MFELFTDRARRVLVLASEEATALHHADISEGHVLVGAAREGGGVAARVLQSFGVEDGAVRDALLAVMPPGTATSARDALATVGIDLDGIKDVVDGAFGAGSLRIPGESLLWSASTKRVFELAHDAALALAHNYIGTEHLLLALMRVEGRLVPAIIESLGMTCATVEERTLLVVARFPAITNQPSRLRGLRLRRGVNRLPADVRPPAAAVLARTLDTVDTYPNDEVGHNNEAFAQWLAADDINYGRAVAEARTQLGALGVLAFVDAVSSLADGTAAALAAAVRRVSARADALDRSSADDEDSVAALARAIRARQQANKVATAAWQQVWDDHTGAAVDHLAAILGRAAAQIDELSSAS